jgi:hypothetical protein
MCITLQNDDDYVNMSSFYSTVQYGDWYTLPLYSHLDQAMCSSLNYIRIKTGGTHILKFLKRIYTSEEASYIFSIVLLLLVAHTGEYQLSRGGDGQRGRRNRITHPGLYKNSAPARDGDYCEHRQAGCNS